MLVLSRKVGEKVIIGDDVVVTIIEARGKRIRIGFECPATVPIHRSEVFNRINESDNLNSINKLQDEAGHM
jgi:carbon storage regulator